MSEEQFHPYRMTLSLSVLRHLGIGLYSNVSAVLSEAVANAWDADAAHVEIEIDRQKIVIKDDGHGMSKEDANAKYLHVGYERRKAHDGSRTPKYNRPVMGRKGIGKLSLLSIADTVEVQSAVDDSAPHGFKMSAREIERQIKQSAENPGENIEYFPEPVDHAQIDRGTRIVLTDLKRRIISTTVPALARRLARRFSIIGSDYNFDITLNKAPITIGDRGYYERLQYAWSLGKLGAHSLSAAKNINSKFTLSSKIDADSHAYAIDGWIGTTFKAGDLKDPETRESINKIVIMTRGKLAQEDILEELGEAGIYSAYLIGEIHADFLDDDNSDDIATTNRQRIVEDDPRYIALQNGIRERLKEIGNRWTDLRNEEGLTVALQIPQINEWYESLVPDHRVAAKRLFGHINRLRIDDDAERRQLFIGSILAFESLRLRNMVSKLDEVQISNFAMFRDVFLQLDDIEQSAFYGVIKNRLDVIQKLTGLVDQEALEKALQFHLHKNLWLIDPAWGWKQGTETMERDVKNALKLPAKQQKARLDIYYSLAGDRHVIIELKRIDRVVSTADLLSQVQKYRAKVSKVLADAGRGNEPVEVICVVGKRLSDWASRDGETQSRRALEAYNTRVVMYNELIDNAQKAYQEYLVGKEEAGRVYKLVTSIAAGDAAALGPDS